MSRADHFIYSTSSPPLASHLWPRDEVLHLVHLLYKDRAARDIVLPEKHLHGSLADGRTDRQVCTAWAKLIWPGQYPPDWNRVANQISWLRHVYFEEGLHIEGQYTLLSEMEEGSRAHAERRMHLQRLPFWDQWVSIARERLPTGEPKQIFTSLAGTKWLQPDGTFDLMDPAEMLRRISHVASAASAHRNANAIAGSSAQAAAMPSRVNAGASTGRASAASSSSVLGNRSNNVGASASSSHHVEEEEDAGFELVGVTNVSERGSPVKATGTNSSAAGKRKATELSESEARVLDAERRLALLHATAQEEAQLAAEQARQQKRRDELRLREQATERMRLQMLEEAEQRGNALNQWTNNMTSEHERAAHRSEEEHVVYMQRQQACHEHQMHLRREELNQRVRAKRDEHETWSRDKVQRFMQVVEEQQREKDELYGNAPPPA